MNRCRLRGGSARSLGQPAQDRWTIKLERYSHVTHELGLGTDADGDTPAR
jgi:hypothetical protein